MLDQLLDLVKQFGKETVVENPEVPNEYNEDIITDATKLEVAFKISWRVVDFKTSWIFLKAAVPHPTLLQVPAVASADY